MKRPNRLTALLEAATITGEYWLLPDGSLLYATDGGDHNHEGWVYEYVVGYYLNAVNETEWGREIFGEDWADRHGYDYALFRDTFVNETDARGIDMDEADDEVDAILTKQFGPEQVKWFYPIVSNGIDQRTGRAVDAREFAIKFWKWVRIAFNNAELPDISPATLKRVGEGFCQIMWEESGEEEPDYETEVTISTYDGTRNVVTIHNLLDGRISGADDASHEALRQAGRRAVDELDKAAVPSFYKGVAESHNSYQEMKLLEALEPKTAESSDF